MLTIPSWLDRVISNGFPNECCWIAKNWWHCLLLLLNLNTSTSISILTSASDTLLVSRVLLAWQATFYSSILNIQRSCQYPCIHLLYGEFTVSFVALRYQKQSFSLSTLVYFYAFTTTLVLLTHRAPAVWKIITISTYRLLLSVI